MSLLEVSAVVLGLAYVLLISFSKRIGWVFGVLSCGIYVWLTFETHLYLQAILQFIYVVLGFYGFFSWGNSESHVQKMQLKSHFFWGIPALAIALLLGYTFSFYGQKMPYLDAFITGFSLLATYFATRMWMENWLYWMVLNLLSAYLFWEQGLVTSTVLFLVNAALAVFGYFQWKRLLDGNN